MIFILADNCKIGSVYLFGLYVVVMLELLWKGKHSRTSTSGHLSTTASFFLPDSPYIRSCFNLSTLATFFCPQGDSYREVQLNAYYLPFPSILSVVRL